MSGLHRRADGLGRSDVVIRIGSAKFCVVKIPWYVQQYRSLHMFRRDYIRYKLYDNTRAISLLIGVHHITLRWRVSDEVVD